MESMDFKYLSENFSFANYEPWVIKYGFTDDSTWMNYFPWFSYDPDRVLSKALSPQLI